MFRRARRFVKQARYAAAARSAVGAGTGIATGTGKRVIFRWGPICGRGIGDALRGIVTVHHMSRQLGIQLEIDMVDNPLCDVLIYTTPKDTHDEYTRCAADMMTIHDDKFNTQEFAKLLMRRQTLVLFSSSYPQFREITQDIEFVRNLMVMKEEHIHKVPTQPYRLIHIRVGDSYMVDNKEAHSQQEHWHPKQDPSVILSRLQRAMRKHHVVLKPGDFIITDCNILKPVLANSYAGILMDDSEGQVRAGHLGMESTPEQTAATVCDIQRIIHAEEVISFSTYPWASNFVYWFCKCHSVHLNSYTF
jgi:hypothetical protein